MTNQQITQIEIKAKELTNLLTNWTQQIATYQLQLAEIIKKVNEIKKQK